MSLLACILVALSLFVVCLADGECSRAEGSCKALGAASLIQIAGKIDRTTPSPRAQLLRSISQHWVRVVEEDVVPNAKLVSCEHLPVESLEYYRGINKLASVCTSDGVPGRKIPSRRDLSFYVQFVEAPCTDAEPHLNSSHIVDCVFGTAEQPPSSFDAWSKFNWDNLAAFTHKHAAELKGLQDTCAQLFGDGGECSLSLVQSQAREPQRTQNRIDKVRWLTRPVEHPLAKSMGYVHSLLELQAEGNHYELDIFPGDVGAQVIAREVDTASDPERRVHFELSGDALKSDLSVSAVLDELSANSKGTYDLIHNNCHSMIQETLHRIAAPGVDIPDSPNSKWEMVAAKLDHSAPKALELFLRTSGANRLGCN